MGMHIVIHWLTYISDTMISVLPRSTYTSSCSLHHSKSMRNSLWKHWSESDMAFVFALVEKLGMHEIWTFKFRFDHKVKINQSTPKTTGVLTKVFLRGQARLDTHKNTHRQTQAMTIREGQIYPVVRMASLVNKKIRNISQSHYMCWSLLW